MQMLTSVSAETINNLSPDAGVVMFGVSLDDVNDVAGLMSLVETTRDDPEKWMGVTDGGVKASEGRKFWSPNFDYKRLPVVGDKHLDTAEPKVSFTLLENTPENVKRASGAADITTSGGKMLVQPRAHIKTGDYIDKLLYLIFVGTDKIYAIEADNVLCTKGMDFSSGDKKVGQYAVEFMAHKGDYTDAETLPMRYYFIPAAA